jgi:hypothetical protein
VYPCENCKDLHGNIARYEKNIHPKTDRGDVLVIGKGFGIDSESLNFVETFTIERKVYRIWMKHSFG